MKATRQDVLNEMTRRMPYKELEYRNLIVASAIVEGHKDELTYDWLNKTLLGDVTDGFIEYGQAMAIKEKYMTALEEVKRMF